MEELNKFESVENENPDASKYILEVENLKKYYLNRICYGENTKTK